MFYNKYQGVGRERRICKFPIFLYHGGKSREGRFMRKKKYLYESKQEKKKKKVNRRRTNKRQNISKLF